MGGGEEKAACVSVFRIFCTLCEVEAKRNQTNVFSFVSPGDPNNPTNVVLSIAETSSITWAKIGILELFNNTTATVTVDGTMLLPTTPAILQPGCAMQLQYIGNDANNPKVAVVGGSNTSIIDHAPSATGNSLIKETKDGSTKMMRLQGSGTVSIKEHPDGVLEITDTQRVKESASADVASVHIGRLNVIDAGTQPYAAISLSQQVTLANIGDKIHVFNNANRPIKIDAGASGVQLQGPPNLDAVAKHGICVLTKLNATNEWSLTGDLTLSKPVNSSKTPAQNTIDKEDIGRIIRLGGSDSINLPDDDIGFDGDKVFIHNAGVNVMEVGSGSVAEVISCNKHDAVIAGGFVTMRKIGTFSWHLSGDTCRKDRIGSPNENVTGVMFGRLNIYEPQSDNDKIELGEIVPIQENTYIELYNMGTEKLQIATNDVNIWSADDHTAVKPKGAAILRYMGRQGNPSNQTWALIGAIES